MKNDIIATMEKIGINIKMTPELREALQDIAKREGIPVSKVVLVSLAEKYPELVPLIIKH